MTEERLQKIENVWKPIHGDNIITDLIDEIRRLRAELEAARPAVEACPTCGRRKAKRFEDVIGCCPKWYAIRDPLAEKDCAIAAGTWLKQQEGKP